MKHSLINDANDDVNIQIRKNVFEIVKRKMSNKIEGQVREKIISPKKTNNLYDRRFAVYHFIDEKIKGQVANKIRDTVKKEFSI